jgi:hypothetical protein
MNWLKYLVGLSAIVIAASAAYFSISGLSKLFAGATMAIVIMASSLEFAKLVAATYLKQKWNIIQGFNKFYLSLAVAILMLITSAGIYGFLTSAYQTTSDQLAIIEQQVSISNLKKDRYKEQLTGYTQERNSLSTSISELSKGLSNNVIKYTDKDGKEVITTSGAARRTLELQLNDMKKQRDNVSNHIEVLNDSITKLDLKALNIQSNNSLAHEVGPLKYLSNLTGASMDKVVNWFALSIVLVFDPLAIALIIAFNGLVIEEESKSKQLKEEAPVNKDYEIYGDDKKIVKVTPERYDWNEDKWSKSGLLKDVKLITPEEQNKMAEVLEPKPQQEITDNEWHPDDIKELSKLADELELPKEPEPTPQPQPEEKRQPSAFKEYSGYPTPEPVSGPAEVTELPEDITKWEPPPIISGRKPRNDQPYYTDIDFDWSDRSKWINDQNAVNFWLKNKRPSQEEQDELHTKY